LASTRKAWEEETGGSNIRLQEQHSTGSEEFIISCRDFEEHPHLNVEANPAIPTLKTLEAHARVWWWITPNVIRGS
jgi:hypothetical protein